MITRESDTHVGGPPSPERLALYVLDDGLAAIHDLTSETCTIGRGACDVRIFDPSVSRRHATLCTRTMTVRDHGSANGTSMRGERLAPDVAAPLVLDETIRIGNVAVVVRARAGGRARTVCGPGVFALRVGEACGRSARSGTPFAVVTLAAVELAALESLLRPSDVVGHMDDGELGIFVPGATPADTDRLAANLQRRFGVRVRVACFPRDARPAPPPQAVAAMQRLEELLAKVAVGTISVLVLGETGVGKEVLAERIHAASRRADKPLVRLNCAALSESLLESELFGYEKGAFTGAAATKIGLLESAHGGTVFLDEIGELPMTTQVKLLRVLEQREVLRVGAVSPRPIDVRFIAATHRDLPALIAASTFRQDLYFRLNGITLTIPPLRERMSELERLALHFLARAAQLNQTPPPVLAPDALEVLRAHTWPGNIRELRNVIERAVLLSSDRIHADAILLESSAASSAAAPRRASLPAERDRIVAALAEAAGNQTLAAELLGISRRTLINRIIQYGIARPRKVSHA